MPGRKYKAGSGLYRYGFNGKENDNEVKGDGNEQDYGMRIYEPRIGRFLSEDPITKNYPELTPYQFASNRPVDGIDEDGLEFLKDFNSNQNKYFQAQRDAMLKPRESVQSYDPSKKSFTQSWRDSKNFFANITYQMANGLYTFPQQLTRGITGQSQISNIGGNTYPAGGVFGEKERIRNFADFAGTIMPGAAAESKGANLFNKVADNTLTRLEQKVMNEAAEQTMSSVKDKLARYLLNPEHSTGATKAKWFEKALGFSQKNSEDLAKQIVFDADKAVVTEVTAHGTKFTQTISITGANNKVIEVAFKWIKNKDNVVRLVTAIPTKK